jgi:hypothetical protein
VKALNSSSSTGKEKKKQNGKKNEIIGLGAVVHISNASDSGGSDWKDCCLSSVLRKK